jgi:hypothetical protein
VGHREVEARGASQRRADERDPGEPEGTDERIEVFGRTVGRIGGTGAAQTSGIIPDDAERPGELQELVIPHSPVEVAGVEQDDRGTSAG